MEGTIMNKPESRLERALRVAAGILVGVVWSSALIFGLYIFVFYFIALMRGNSAQWNEVLPGIYDTETPAATLGIGLHFAAGSVILILGCIQLIDRVRIKYPILHRWLGRVYISASIVAAIGGLVFIFQKGTIGGVVMDVGFSGYGILMLIAAISTVYFARKKQFIRHRAWSIRLFALAIGSWLYRMDYGFWFLITHNAGHTQSFDGPFDQFMSFFFYLPNLIVAEIFIGRYPIVKSKFARYIAIASIYLATTFLVLATYFFTKRLWGPAILGL